MEIIIVINVFLFKFFDFTDTKRRKLECSTASGSKVSMKEVYS